MREDDTVLITLSSGLKVILTKEQMKLLDKNKEENERVIRDIYDVVKSMHDYNVRELRYWGNDRCCCCGDTDKEKFFILCKQCASFWDSGNEARNPLVDIYWALNDKVIKFPSLEEFRDKFSDNIKLAIPHIGKRLLGTHGEERLLGTHGEERGRYAEEKGKTVFRLISCLREREKQMVMDTQFIDDLISSVAQRWNLEEIAL